MRRMDMHHGSCPLGIALQIPVHPELTGRLLLLVDLRHSQPGRLISDDLQSNDMFRMNDRLAPTGRSDVEIFSIPFFHTNIAVSCRNPSSLIAAPHDIANSRQHDSSLKWWYSLVCDVFLVTPLDVN